MGGVLMLTGTRPLSQRVARAVNGAFPDARFVFVSPAPRWPGLWRRIRRRGAVTAFGQVVFRALLVRMGRRAEAETGAMWARSGLPDAPIAEAQIARVSSVNGPEVQRIMHDMSADVVLVFAVPKLSRATIAAAGEAPILNLHPGITPEFRGVHTGYWALRRGAPERFGVTVHLIDEGLDTGPIVDQATCDPEGGIAHHNVQLAIRGFPLWRAAAERALDGTLTWRDSGPELPICLEPTIWSYLYGGLRHGVW